LLWQSQVASTMTLWSTNIKALSSMSVTAASDWLNVAFLCEESVLLRRFILWFVNHSYCDFFSAELTWIPLSLNEIKNNVIPQHSFEQFERFAFVNSVAYVSLNTSRLRYESGVFNLFSSLWSVTGLLGIIPAVMIHQFKTKRILTKRAIDARVCKQKGPSCKYVLTDPSISAYY